MWTVMVLLCSTLDPSSCLATGGPAFSTQSKCMQNFQAVGISYLKRTYPNSKVLGARCIEWGKGVSA